MSPEQLFGADQQVVVAPVGESMRPMLRVGRDTVALSKIAGPLKPGDVALYERPNGALVLHRVMAVRPEGYAFLGDAQPMAALETGVTEARLLGVMVGFFRGSKYHGARDPLYRVYCRLCLSGRGGRRVLRGVWKGYLAVKRALGAFKKNRGAN